MISIYALKNNSGRCNNLQSCHHGWCFCTLSHILFSYTCILCILYIGSKINASKKDLILCLSFSLFLVLIIIASAHPTVIHEINTLFFTLWGREASLVAQMVKISSAMMRKTESKIWVVRLYKRKWNDSVSQCLQMLGRVRSINTFWDLER